MDPKEIHVWKKNIPDTLYKMLNVNHTQKMFTEETDKRKELIEQVITQFRDAGGDEFTIRSKLYFPIDVAHQTARHMAQVYIKPYMDRARQGIYICKLEGPHFDTKDIDVYFKPLWDATNGLLEDVATEIKHWVTEQKDTVKQMIQTTKDEQIRQLSFDLHTKISFDFNDDWLSLPNEDVLRLIVKNILSGFVPHSVELDIYMDNEISVYTSPVVEDISVERLEYIKYLYDEMLWSSNDLYIVLTLEKRNRLFGTKIRNNEIIVANPEIVFVQDNQTVKSLIPNGFAETFETWMDKS